LICENKLLLKKGKKLVATDALTTKKPSY